MPARSMRILCTILAGTCTALPPAVMQFLLAERYRQEPERVAAMILLGNALAVVFVPVALALAL